MLRKIDINGHPYIGVFCKGSENLVLTPPNISKLTKKQIEETLDAKIIQLCLGGSTIIGTLVSLNSYGIVVTNFATDEELEVLKKELPVLRIPEKLNAVGNNILVNDICALVHPGYSNKTIQLIQDTLGVETIRGTVAKLKTVGSAALATNKGLLCHPHLTKEEMKLLKESFKLPVSIGTINYGTPYIGACVIANSKGALLGRNTTPIEIGRVEDALELI